MKKPSNLTLKVILLVLCAAALILWAVWEIPCPIRHFTGIPCPGCGMGRAWLAALHLDLVQAFRYHPMFWAVPVAALFILFDFRLLPKQRHNTLVMVLLALAVAICYLIRLTAFFRGELAI